jgi:hypothetical protein
MNSSEFYESLKGKGIIVFSDPSAAKTCLSLAKICSFSNRECTFQIFSNKIYSFYEDWNLDIKIVEDFNEISFDKVDWVFSGTSHPDSSLCFENSIVKFAIYKNIKTFAFVDQWKNVNIRFNFDNELVFPDLILVPDEYSKIKLIEQNLENEKIQVLKNPYLYYIEKFWKINKTKEELIQFLNLTDKSKKIIVYAPDPFTLRGQDLVFGFDEFSVLNELIEIINSNEFFLVVKLHPLQPQKNKFTEMIESNKNIFVDINNLLENLEISFYSSHIIGFYSNFLLEANQIAKSVIRYFPKNSNLDIFDHLNFGKKICSFEELVDAIH